MRSRSGEIDHRNGRLARTARIFPGDAAGCDTLWPDDLRIAGGRRAGAADSADSADDIAGLRRPIPPPERDSIMKQSIRTFAWVLPSMLLVFACTLPGNLNPVATEVPSGGILFEDDFSNQDGGWDSLSDEYGVTSYSDGKYLISVDDSMSFLYSDPDSAGSYADTRIEVDVIGSDEQYHDMGIICRLQDTDNFYYFIVASDGFYAIGKFKDGEDTLIGSDEMYEDIDGVINQGVADNHIRADCVGNTLSLYVNSKKLMEVTDTDFTKGTVGLIAGSYEDVPVSILFDNFAVYKP